MTQRKRMWTVEAGFYGLFIVYDEDGNVLARDKTQGVACLIAAAPELLEALKAVEPYVGRWHDGMAQWIGDTYDQAKEKFSLKEVGFFEYIETAQTLRMTVRAAIAKAEVPEK